MQTYCSCCLHLVLQNESVSGPYFLYNSLTFFCTWRECEISVLALPNGENSFLIFVWNVLDRKTCLKRISPYVQVGIQFTFIVINPRVSQATRTIRTSQVGCHRFIMMRTLIVSMMWERVFWSVRTTGLGKQGKFPSKWVSMVILEESSLVSLLSTLHYSLFY